MKVVIYIRVSTDEQAKHGYSIGSQLEKLKAFCISQDWVIIESYTDEGYSAKDLNRPKFTEMMDRINKGDIDVLLVYRLDRLTRSVGDLHEILKKLDKNNCMFRSATEVYDTTTATGRMFITLVAAMAQWERETISERVRLNMESKTKKGKWKGGSPPFGYLYENDQLKINEEESQVVKKIFEMSRTLGFYTIAKQLTAKGYPTKKGGEWHVDTVRDIANNPTYAGYLTFNSSPKESRKPPREQRLYEGIHERIIEREEFWDLQEILDRRRTFGGKRETSNYYFSSILKCGRCGHSMSGHKSVGRKTYRCSGKKAGKNCTSHIILEDNLIIKVLSMLDELVENLVDDPGITDNSTEMIKELQADLKSIEKDLKKHKNMYRNDIIDIDELIEVTKELREKEKYITAELKKYKKSTINLDEVSFIAENITSMWDHANDYERKQMITTIFSQLVIDTVDDYKRGSGQSREIIIKSVK